MGSPSTQGILLPYQHNDRIQAVGPLAAPRASLEVGLPDGAVRGRGRVQQPPHVPAAGPGEKGPLAVVIIVERLSGSVAEKPRRLTPEAVGMLADGDAVDEHPVVAEEKALHKARLSAHVRHQVGHSEV
ncbi:hypothetical protein OCS_01271 [Ophiocordyceps sinensis CO18]|uniref:Uncharacterized protein n=1 Tax=Ophiocordyceps sinensis (strain Co18 / CGMCC 3.14243) TaxID=911162 RepID=T5AMP5_OPHSC|nr:hypothetical protein OCS_01271 [Ophiocordyceps sinensis CO18]